MITAVVTQNTEILGSGNTVASIGIGTAAPDRIVFLMGATADSALTASTIGGVSAIYGQLDIGALRLAIWYAVVPTGTTADLVTTSANPAYVFGAYALYGVLPTAIASNASVAASTTVNTLANGIVVGFSLDSPAAAVTWPVLSEGFDYTIVGGSLAGAASVSGAVLFPTTTQTPMTVQANTAAAVLAVSFNANPVPRKSDLYQRLRRAA